MKAIQFAAAIIVASFVYSQLVPLLAAVRVLEVLK